MRRAIAFTLILIASPTAFGQEASSVDFSREVQPIFARQCFQCHGSGEQEGGLRLDSRTGALAKLESENRAVVPGETIVASADVGQLRCT